MEFNFNYFFGLESQINGMQDKMLLALFAIVMYGQVFLILLTGFLRKFKISIFRSQLNVMILTLGLTTFFGTLVTLLLSFLVYDCSKVKVLYCWIAVLISMFYFSVFNYNKVKNFLTGFR